MQGMESDGLTLDSKVTIARVVIRDVLSQRSKPVICWSAGRDSMIVLWLVDEIITELGLRKVPLLFVNHGLHFEETLQFAKEVTTERNLTLLELNAPIRTEFSADPRTNKGQNSVASGEGPYADENERRNEAEQRTDDVLESIWSSVRSASSQYGFDSIFTGLKIGERPSEISQSFVRGHISERYQYCNPILLFDGSDSWTFTHENRLPIHPLYGKGFQSVFTKFERQSKEKRPAWESIGPASRFARTDPEETLERLKSWGYA